MFVHLLDNKVCVIDVPCKQEDCVQGCKFHSAAGLITSGMLGWVTGQILLIA